MLKKKSCFPDYGQSTAEYIIAIFLIAIVVLVSIRLFGKSIACQYYQARTKIESGQGLPAMCLTTTTSTSSTTTTSTSTTSTTSTTSSTSSTTTTTTTSAPPCLPSGATKRRSVYNCGIADFIDPRECCKSGGLQFRHEDYYGTCAGSYQFIHSWRYLCP